MPGPGGNNYQSFFPHTVTKEQSELESRKHLTEFLQRLEQVNNGQQLSVGYRRFVADLKSLLDVTAPFYVVGEQGYPTVSAADQQKILAAYNKAAASTDRVLAEIKRLGDQGDPTLGTSVEECKRYLGQDIRTLTDLSMDGTNNLPDAIYEGRTNKVNVPDNVSLGKVGASASSRIPFRYKDADGIEHKGFFTENSNYDAITKFKEEARRFAQKYPKYRHLFNAIAEYNYDHGKSDPQAQSIWLANPTVMIVRAELYGHKKEEFADIQTDDDKYKKINREFLESVRGLLSGVSLQEVNKFEKDGNVASRNTAMSRMAHLMGIPNVVAGSREITFVRDGVEHKGHFMDAATGEDFSNVRDGDPLTVYGEEVYNNGEGLRNLSALQVLDYICGNTDRHQSNYMYNFDTTDPFHPKFIGPTGIDNDLSFGTIVPDPEQKPGNNGVCLNSIKTIPKSLADSITALQPETVKLALADMKLSDAEIDACVARLNQVKERIELCRGLNFDLKTMPREGMQIVEDNAYDRLTMKDLAVDTKDENARNLFDRLIYVRHVARHMAEENAKKDVEKEQERNAQPRDINAKEEEFFKEVEAVDANSKRFYEERSEKFQEMFDKLSATEGTFHGSKQQYKDMKASLKELIDAGKGEVDSASYQVALNKMQESVKAYLDYKKDNLSRSTAKKRFALAKDLQELTNNVKGELFDAMENQAERDAIAMNRDYNKPEEVKVEPSVEDYMRDMDEAAEDLRNDLAFITVDRNTYKTHADALQRMFNAIDQKYPNDKLTDSLLAKNEKDPKFKQMYNELDGMYNKYWEGIDVPYKYESKVATQANMMKFSASVQKIARILDKQIPNTEGGVKGEIGQLLHQFVNKVHPNVTDSYKLLDDLGTKLRENNINSQNANRDGKSAVLKSVADLVEKYDTKFKDMNIDRAEQFINTGRHPVGFEDFVKGLQNKRQHYVAPPEKQAEQAKNANPVAK